MLLRLATVYIHDPVINSNITNTNINYYQCQIINIEITKVVEITDS